MTRKTKLTSSPSRSLQTAQVCPHRPEFLGLCYGKNHSVSPDVLPRALIPCLAKAVSGGLISLWGSLQGSEV